jgi:diaminopimelate epimerase
VKIIVADPAKNITVFVLDPVESMEERSRVSRAILADSRFKAEQVGFVIPPNESGDLWHLEMMGGEFCGNAARSFGLYVARLQGLKGKAEIEVSVSGVERPVRVEVDLEKSHAAAEMPKPELIETVDYKGRSLPAIVFEGITHVIAPDIEALGETFYAIKTAAEKKLSPPPAFGVMFYDAAVNFTHPAVYVAATDSLVFESSCGSGSAALGAWLSGKTPDCAIRYALSQPGGVIETEVIKKEGKIIRVSIGGEVALGEEIEFS